MSQQWLWLAGAGIAAGVALVSFWPLGFGFALFLALLSPAIFLTGLVSGGPRRKQFFAAGFFFVFLALGAARMEWASRSDYRLLTAFVGQEAVFRGTVVDEPDERERSWQLVFKPEGMKSKILVTLPRHQRFAYGDRLTLRGKLILPRPFVAENGRLVDWPAHLAKDDIFYQVFNPKAELISLGGFGLRRVLFSLKTAWLAQVGRILPEPESSLAGGLIVGARQSLGEEWQRAFRRTGIIHIVVLSGYNVTIVADSIMRMFSFLPRFAGAGLAGSSIVLFALMTGAGPTVVRASIMALLVLTARAGGRLYNIGRALILAGVLMILYNPKSLIFDLGFQLSFLATVGLIYLSPIFEKRLGFLPERFGLRSIVSVTVAAQLFVLPWILYKTGALSLVALPVNLLVLPAVPAAMFFGFLTGALGFIATFLAQPFGYLSFLILAYQFRVVEWFNGFSFAATTLPAFPLWLALGCYLFYCWLIYRFHRQSAKV